MKLVVMIERQANLVVLGVPEDDTVFCSVRLRERVHHCVGAVAPLKTENVSNNVYRDLL